jgi:hypothetical protein
MKKNNYSLYFRVFKNDTAVTKVSTNDFLPLTLIPEKGNWLIAATHLILGPIAKTAYALLPDKLAYAGYADEAKAMEMAKLGAQEYINRLIGQGKAGEKALLQYRRDHYEDLHINLVFANIENVKREEEGLDPIIIPDHHDIDC